jgi:hypothetical protein
MLQNSWDLIFKTVFYIRSFAHQIIREKGLEPAFMNNFVCNYFSDVFLLVLKIQNLADQYNNKPAHCGLMEEY